MLASARRRRRDEERGATTVIVALVMSLVLIGSAALAVDLGQQRVVRSDVQAVADMVALDLARDLTGRPASSYSVAAFDAARDESVARNADAFGGELAPGDVAWEFVRWDEAAGDWVVVQPGSAEVPTAVRVEATSDVGFAFGPALGTARGGATRDAVAESTESACYRIGSFIASLDSSQSALLNPILSALLGSNVNLGLVGYQGLATANVSLLDLVEVPGLGVGSVNELLELEDVSVATLFIAAATVLENGGGQGNLAAANVLRALSVSANTPHIDIADIIDAQAGDPAALDATINVLDLITGAAFVANENHAVSIPNLGISLPGVASVSTSLSVIESPRTRCGPRGTTNETAQVRLRLTAQIPARSVGVNILGVAGVNVNLAATQVTLDVDLGRAIAELRAVTCGASGPESIRVALQTAVVGSIGVAANLGAQATITVPLLGSGGLLGQILSLLGLGSLLNPPEIVLNASLGVSSTVPPEPNYDREVTVPIPGGYTVPVGSGSGPVLGPLSASVTGTTNMTIKYGLLGTQSKVVLHADPLYNTVLNPVLSAVASSLNSLVSTLQTALIAPLADLLGLQLGGADVFAVPTPTCTGPRLVG